MEYDTNWDVNFRSHIKNFTLGSQLLANTPREAIVGINPCQEMKEESLSRTIQQPRLLYTAQTSPWFRT